MRRAIFFVTLVLLGEASARADGAWRHGEPVPDPAGVIDLPAGFTYTIVARAGDKMTDTRRVPALPDGMGAFEGPDGTTIVVCNHECIYPKDGPFGQDDAMRAKIDTPRLYDPGDGTLPPAGSTTTFIWDTRTQSLVRHFLSLAGTIFNCSGGVTPWGSWLTCEEKTYRAGWTGEDGEPRTARDHGWVFEVPATDQPQLADAVPISVLGRFTHESLVYDARTGMVYQTEDLHDGLFYRFVPASKGDLRAGRLQALALHNGTRESCNCATDAPRIRVGQRLKVKWIDMDRVDAPEDDLRIRGYDLGACRFDRGEGMTMLDGDVYFVSTSGGAARAGQIWRYRPSPREGAGGEWREPGTLELWYEVEDTTRLVNPDNITATASGDLLVCEDPEDAGYSRMVVLTRTRDTYTFARSCLPGELTGAVFAPDGSTLFVNMQLAGITLAVTGPWHR